MRGKGSSPPLWGAILQAAEEWHTPPWVIEAECSRRWWMRYLAYNEVRVQAQQQKR